MCGFVGVLFIYFDLLDWVCFVGFFFIFQDHCRELDEVCWNIKKKGLLDRTAKLIPQLTNRVLFNI